MPPSWYVYVRNWSSIDIGIASNFRDNQKRVPLPWFNSGRNNISICYCWCHYRGGGWLWIVGAFPFLLNFFSVLVVKKLSASHDWNQYMQSQIANNCVQNCAQNVKQITLKYFLNHSEVIFFFQHPDQPVPNNNRASRLGPFFHVASWLWDLEVQCIWMCRFPSLTWL